MYDEHQYIVGVLERKRSRLNNDESFDLKLYQGPLNNVDAAVMLTCFMVIVETINDQPRKTGKAC